MERTSKRTFYTALYHSLISPSLFSDIDGNYLGMDGKIYKSEENKYHIFSLWDTFRALHPLLALVYPEINKLFINTLIDKYVTGGWLPVWELAGNYTNCMIGDHAISVITDGYLKDIKDFDKKLALQAMLKGSTQLPGMDEVFKGRIGICVRRLLSIQVC